MGWGWGVGWGAGEEETEKECGEMGVWGGGGGGEWAVQEPIILQAWLSDTHPPPNSATNVPLVEFTYLVFTRMPGESYHRWLRSLLLYLCYTFQALINSLVCWFCREWLHHRRCTFYLRASVCQNHPYNSPAVSAVEFVKHLSAKTMEAHT